MRQPYLDVLKVVMLLGVTLLAACDGVRRTPMTEQSRVAIERIALPRVESPSRVAVATSSGISSGFYGFGAVGGLIAGSLNSVASSGSSKSVMTSMNGRHGDLGAHFTDALKATLAESGYQVQETVVQRKEPGTLLEDLGGVSFEGDALLDVIIDHVGFSGPGGRFLRPWVSVQVKLLERSSGRTLYADEIYYADISGYADSPAIKPDQGATFATLTELTDDPDRALSVLQTGLELVAKRVGERMDRRNRGVLSSAAAPQK